MPRARRNPPVVLRPLTTPPSTRAEEQGHKAGHEGKSGHDVAERQWRSIAISNMELRTLRANSIKVWHQRHENHPRHRDQAAQKSGHDDQGNRRPARRKPPNASQGVRPSIAGPAHRLGIWQSTRASDELQAKATSRQPPALSSHLLLARPSSDSKRATGPSSARRRGRIA